MPGIMLTDADATELADLLRFLGEWLAAGHDQLSDSLSQFMDGHPYGVEALRHDLARFRSLLGDDGDGTSFLRHPHLGQQEMPAPASTAGGQRLPHNPA